MAIDYNDASQTYDGTRHSDSLILQHWQRRVPLNKTTHVLDFGCGTGNYLQRIQDHLGCVCFGVEPSDGMRSKAIAKNPQVEIRAGNHQQIPFADDSFDFIYMTDVVHHVPDLGQMFAELRRVLQPAGALCIVTESHPQIKARFYNPYFPSLSANECARYPSLAAINDAAAPFYSSAIIDSFPHQERQIDDAFLQNGSQKNYSMFRLLDEAEFQSGLAALTRDKGRRFPANGAGYSLAWFGTVKE